MIRASSRAALMPRYTHAASLELFYIAHMVMGRVFGVAVQQVRRSRIQEGGCVSTDKLADLRYMVTQLAVQPGSHTFFSCVEDGSVWHVSCELTSHL
jgi:hypothetical protein